MTLTGSSADATGGAAVSQQQPEAPAVPSVTRWQVRGPLFVDAIQWTGENEPDIAAFVGDAGTFEVKVGGFAVVWNRATGECVNLAAGCWIVLGVTGIFFGCSADEFAATYEPAPEPLTASQCDRLRQTAAEHANAVEAVKRACNLAVKLGGAYPEVNETVAAAREALRVLSGEETDAGPGSAIVETLEALPVAAALDRESLREIVKATVADFTKQPGPALRDRITDAIWPLLEHAQYALSDNEGVRLWMLDCGELVAKHRARAEAAAAELTGLRSLLEGGPAGAAARRRALAIIGTEEDNRG